jgi:tape measure domain-containing protein
MNERVVTELVIDARPAQAGTAEYERAMTRAAAAVDRVKAKSQDLRLDSNLPRSVERVTQAYDRLRSSIDPVTRAQVKAEQEIRNAMRLVDRAVTTGVATQQQASATLSALRQRQVADIERVRAAQMRLNSTPAVPTGATGAISGEVAGAGAVGAIGGLRGVLGPLAGYLSARQVMDWADAWTSAGNQLRAVQQITGTQVRSLEQLNDMAKQTRSSFADTADLYAKLVRSSSGVARSEQELADATIIVNEAFKAGGAAAEEQSAGILQLSQALSSGVLQGDELRSLRENAPLIAKAIADEFHTTIGGLKALGASGALTSQRIFTAILKGGDDIRKAFEQTNSTLGEGWTQLGNTMIETLGHLDKATGFTSSFVAELNRLSDAIDKVGQNPNLDNFLGVLDMKIVPGGPADKVRNFINQVIDDAQKGHAAMEAMADGRVQASHRSTEAILADLDQVEERLKRLGGPNAEYTFDVKAETNEAMQDLRQLQAELLSTSYAAQSLSAAMSAISGAGGVYGNVLAQVALQSAKVPTVVPGVTRLSPTTQGPITTPTTTGPTLHQLNVTDYLSGKFASGGFTGHMPANQVAGLVHGGEFVFDAASTARLGVRNLEAIRRGVMGFAAGGPVSAGPDGGASEALAKLDLIEQHGFDALDELKRLPGYLQTIEDDSKASLAVLKTISDGIGALKAAQSYYSGGGGGGGYPATGASGSSGGGFSGGGGTHYASNDARSPYYYGGIHYPGGAQYNPVADFLYNGNYGALGADRRLALWPL